MEEGPKPILSETISALRRSPKKRSVPVDLATFMRREAMLAEARARVRLGRDSKEKILDGELDHVHLIGDVLTIAEAVAIDCREMYTENERFKCTNERLGHLFVNRATNNPNDGRLLAELVPLVDEKMRLITVLAEMFGQKIRVVSGLEFVQSNPDIAERIMKTLATVFGNINDRGSSVDIVRYECDRDGRIMSPDDFGHGISWLDLVRSGLPRSRLQGSDRGDRKRPSSEGHHHIEIAQASNGYYGVTEAGLHTGVIECGGEVATYQGSEHAGEPPTSIIANMKRLAEVAVFMRDNKQLELARLVHERLLIDPRLNGRVGFASGDAKPADPFTLDAKIKSKTDYTIIFGEPRKLPLLVYQRGLRPVQPNEVNDFVVDRSSGGIVDSPKRIYPWRRNVRTLAKLFESDEGRFDRVIDSMGGSITRDSLTDWSASVMQGRDDDGDEKSNRDFCLVPAGRSEAAGHLVHAIACEVVEKMEKSREAA